MARLTHAVYEAAGWGLGDLWFADGRVVQCDHPREQVAQSHKGSDAPGGARSARSTELVAQSHEVQALAARLRDWFAGAEDDFLDVELDLEWCTPFRRAAIEALRAVPRGEVVTYGELAALAGRPGAARAAGSICATNRFAVIVPCHRVVSSSGLGGFGDLGEDYKRRMLRVDGVAV